MKTILFVMLSLYGGGAEKSLVNLLNELPPDKYQVDLLLFRKEGLYMKQVPAWVNILETPDSIKKLYAPLKESKDFTITKIVGTGVSKIKERNNNLRRLAYRWIHFYSNKIPGLGKKYDVAVAYLSSEILYFVDEKVTADKKYVWVHNDYRTAMHPKEYDKPYFERMDGIVSISEKCVNILKEEFPEYAEKTYFIENITSSSVIRSRALEFHVKEFDYSKPIILSIGRLNRQKGFDIAIEAASILKKNSVDFTWYVLGDGELEKELLRHIERFNVSDCFKLLGARENPYPYIKECTIFAQTSRWEGKSVVLDEAKILSKPILATNYPTVYDQIKDSIEGVVVEMNPEAIADGVGDLIRNPKKREKLANYLQSHEYGNQDEIKKYMALLDA